MRIDDGKTRRLKRPPLDGHLPTWQQSGRRPRLGRVSKCSEEFRRQAAILVGDARRPVRQVARELGVNHETLRNWVAALRRESAAPGGPVSADERAEIAQPLRGRLDQCGQGRSAASAAISSG